MHELIQIPPHLWKKSILVKNRVRFIEYLQKGQIMEFYFVDEIDKKSLDTVFAKWHLIRFGLNCILNY